MQEHSDNYQNFILKLSTTLRLIHCRNKHQWIVQRLDNDKARWRSISFHRERSSLISLAEQLGADPTPLYQLPERYSSYSKGGSASIVVKDEPTYLKEFLDAPANNLRVTA